MVTKLLMAAWMAYTHWSVVATQSLCMRTCSPRKVFKMKTFLRLDFLTPGSINAPFRSTLSSGCPCPLIWNTNTHWVRKTLNLFYQDSGKTYKFFQMLYYRLFTLISTVFFVLNLFSILFHLLYSISAQVRSLKDQRYKILATDRPPREELWNMRGARRKWYCSLSPSYVLTCTILYQSSKRIICPDRPTFLTTLFLWWMDSTFKEICVEHKLYFFYLKLF